MQIIIAGQGKTDEEALRDNNTKLQRVIDRCSERHVILNAEKMVKGLKEISFHGHTITSKVIKADPKKITALLEMTSPTDEAGVRRWYSIWHDFCQGNQLLLSQLANLLVKTLNIYGPMNVKKASKK